MECDYAPFTPTSAMQQDNSNSTIWRERQLADPVIRSLHPLVKASSKSNPSLCEVTIKPYLREWGRLAIVEGVLYLKQYDLALEK